MIDLLRERPGIAIDELARVLKRSERTIYRWLSDIDSHPRTSVVCEDGGYYISDCSSGRTVDLTPRELLALSMGLKSGVFGQGSPVANDAESAWLKIRDAVCWEKLQDASEMAVSRSVAVSAPAVDLPEGLVETLDWAISSHHQLRIVYRSQRNNRTSEYTIEPYALAFRRHSWYLLGNCIERGKVMQFKLVRFLSAVGTGMRFRPPEDFSVERHFALSWEAWSGGEPVTVRVRFAPEVARMISESRRHPTQIISPQPDGSVIFEVTVAGIEEIAIWIMGYGKHATVLEPDSLRELILDHAQATVANYSTDNLVDSAEASLC